MFINTINKIYQTVLSEKKKLQIEKAVYFLAILTFLIHISLVVLINLQILPISYYTYGGKLPNLLSTIYTPFTIILLYEIYLVIYYLPYSITIYLGKQYEIVSLIIIRSIFDQLARLPVGSVSFTFQNLKGIIYSFAALTVVLFLTFCFYKLSDDKQTTFSKEVYSSPQYYRYVVIKRGLSVVLLALFLFLLAYSVSVLNHFDSPNFGDILTIIKTMNRVFFSSFFNALILTEVLLLLCMYRISDEFEKIIRNSGFIISTVLLKLSFRTEGWVFLVMVILAILFGVVISGIYKMYKIKK
ncbi:MAG: DUF4407 domain-containing protein [Tannerellaceae bacterium]|nr:DUF4407 domain-containing protein [Tannerellaceae bacterium]